jgi:hypothetical protein
MQRSGETMRRGGIRAVGAMVLAACLALAAPRAQAACVGDCHGDGEVTVDEVIVMVDVALGTADLSSCLAGDQNGDGEITVNEIIAAVNNLLVGCPSEASPTVTETAESTPTPTATPAQNGAVPVAEAVARDASGVALHLGQTVTTEGVVTVAAGIFANNKLKVFVQDGGAGIMVYHQSSADVDAFQPGQRLRATGVIRQQDPTSDANPATGTVLVDITQGSASVVSDGNPLPDPQVVTLATLNANGTAYTGTLVRVAGVQKVSGDWPTVGSKSTQVGISDDGGTNTVVLRFQRNTITQPLVQKLNAIGDGSFTLIGIVLQDDEDNNGTLLTDFEIWLRGADDVVTP